MSTKGEDGPDVIRSAVVRVRVPCRADDDLVTDAEYRLSRGAGVTDATVDGIRDLNPGLSATTVTTSVSLRLSRNGIELREELANAPGVESIEELEREDGE